MIRIKRFSESVMILATLLLLSSAVAQDYSPVTDQQLLSPDPGNWLMYRGSYNGWGYSSLDQVNADNVANLVPVWTFSTGTADGPLEGLESPPIVNNGIMFVTTDEAKVVALNAATGQKNWEFQHPLPDDLQQLHPTNRGVGLYEDKVYVATTDAHLIALDANTGEVVWDKTVADYTSGYYITLAPQLVKGKAIVGVSGGEKGIRGFIEAFDAKTGDSAWKTYTVPEPGEPGGDTWPGDTWMHGGGSVWITGTYDPDSNIAYWGVGNAAPWIGATRPGDNLYTSSVLGLDVDTGAIKTYHQYHYNDSWDWDEVDAPLLIDVTRDGKTFPAAVHPGRDGYLWILDRTGGELSFVDGQPFVYNDVITGLDPETGRPEYDEAHKPNLDGQVSFCPSLWGGKDWQAPAFNPDTGYLYVPANENLCGKMQATEVQYQAGQSYTGAQTELYAQDGADHIGELQAWDLNKMEKVWTAKFPDSSNWGSVLTTGGNLVFMGGTNDRYFRAFDATTGEVLWKIRTNSGIIGVPSSFEVDGVQYIAVQSGWGIDAERMQGALSQTLGWDPNVPKGGVVWVFALRDNTQ